MVQVLIAAHVGMLDAVIAKVVLVAQLARRLQLDHTIRRNAMAVLWASICLVLLAIGVQLARIVPALAR